MKISKFWHNKKVLITGGSGFIGQALSKRLSELGAKVCILHKNDNKSREIRETKKRTKKKTGGVVNAGEIINTLGIWNKIQSSFNVLNLLNSLKSTFQNLGQYFSSFWEMITPLSLLISNNPNILIASGGIGFIALAVFFSKYAASKATQELRKTKYLVQIVKNVEQVILELALIGINSPLFYQDYTISQVIEQFRIKINNITKLMPSQNVIVGEHLFIDDDQEIPEAAHILSELLALTTGIHSLFKILENKINSIK